MTNLERIRNMNANELADFLAGCTASCNYCGLMQECDENCPLFEACTGEGGIYEWLKKEG